MEKLSLNTIREEYLKFFENKGHLRMKSFSLVPSNDPSLLLINAGMAPLKKYFTGEEKATRDRVTTCQKCIRTPDIENVGKTARHGTFFEMLGNFSFGDYFKEEACEWAWEFVTKIMKMPIDKLWVTIYLDDDEAFDIWSKKIGVDPEKIVRLGKEDNFWEHGEGPCGPCSEIYFDRGPENGCGDPNCKIGCECDRYVEFWNLVFTQFDKDKEGNYNKLKNPNIDTGMGLERIAAIMQGVNNLFEVDTIRKILDQVCKISKKTYGADSKDDISIRVITDHIRSTTFMISDGVIPSNEGRGYVLRRLLRRAARHGKLLGINNKFLYKLCEIVIEESAFAYPELVDKKDFIKQVIEAEEDKFIETIDQGFAILNDIILKMGNEKFLSGEDAFKLYDTYGFPLDLTLEIMDEQGIGVDKEKFNELMNLQREKARAGRDDKSAFSSENTIISSLNCQATEFLGYTSNSCEAQIKGIISDDQIVKSSNKDCVIVTGRTVFYAESGGQIGDAGTITSENAKGVVYDTKKTSDGKFLHYVKVTEGEFNELDIVILNIDLDRRRSIERNHSVTHILQKTLRNIIGAHVEQAGSYVTDERLRFDFTHIKSLTEDELKQVELEVNRKILEGLDITISEMTYDQAIKTGAMALFGEKYGDQVRVVKMGDFSIEFCGGCHLTNTSKAGMFKIISESGVAAGVRRIEAVTGFNVLKLIKEKENIITETAKVLKTSTTDIVIKANSLNDEIKSMQKEIDQMKSRLAVGSLDEVLGVAIDIKGVNVIITKIDGLDISTLRSLGDQIRDKFENVFALLASVNDDKLNFIAVADKEVVERGIHCGNIIREVSKATGGGGGGKADSAQAGGKDITMVEEALRVAVNMVKDILK